MNKKILMVIAQKNFRDEEFFDPKKVFEDMGAKVTVASNSLDTATGILGGRVKPDICIADAHSEEYDAIVISGGGGSKTYLWDNEDLRSVVMKAYQQDKVVAAICISPVVLAKAGILKGKKCTVFKDAECIRILKDNGAIYEDKGVMSSGNVITSRGPIEATDFGKVVLKMLGE
ncbi:MAG: DJ-1/PfpI family protein [Euryarchaeota archaeon]|nr:DJ-1/PfpI family protein [Euryarchaeota archaeon]